MKIELDEFEIRELNKLIKDAQRFSYDPYHVRNSLSSISNIINGGFNFNVCQAREEAFLKKHHGLNGH